ncbi:MAG: serine hydrolase [Chloroflexota bacterium]|nr:serine hydrolase [Chloroflexota bacterium]
MIRALIASAVVGVLTLVAGAQPGPAGATPAYDFSSVEASIQGQVNAGTFPGASLMLFKDGEIIYEHYFGTFGPSTTVPIASSTKWLSGAVIMSLVDDGVISLDDTVSKYLPGWTGQEGTITIRQLMSHTSGLAADNACLGDATMSLAQCVDQIRDVGLVAPPGSQFYYGGASMQVAGRIAEVATGQSWAQIFNERIQIPLGMTSSFYWPPSNPQIGGGVISRLGDYAKFLQMSLAGGAFGSQQVLTTGAIQEMEKDQTAGAPIVYSPHPDNRRYGIGVWRDVVSGTGQAVQVSSQGKFGMSPWLDRDRRYFGIFFVQDQLADVYLLVAQTQLAVRAVIDAYDTDGDGLADGVDPDDDNDGQLDVNDACPIRATSWPTPIGDNDCDGFTMAIETYVGTDGGLACAATPTANDEAVDAMPADLNDDQKVNVTDRTLMALALKAYIANNVAGYNQRHDLNADGAINVTDRTIVALYIKQTGGLPCTP